MPFYIAKKTSITAVTYKTWLASGGLSPSNYNSLAQVLVDEEAVRRLMTIHASVDCILAMSSADQQTIINNDICAKWINLRDYALNTLSDHAETKALMDAAGKYGYGEWALMPQVPKMTSNGAPYGRISSNITAVTGHDDFKAFDGDDSTYYACEFPSSGTANIGYNFVEPQIIKRIKVKADASTNQAVTKLGIQANVNNSWVSLGSGYALTLVNGYYVLDVDVNPDGLLCSSIILTMEKHQANNDNYCAVNSIQFYAWQPKSSIPVMTYNQSPYGVASSNSESSSRPAYKSMINKAKNFHKYSYVNMYDAYWSNNPGSSAACNGIYVQYAFVNPIEVKEVDIVTMSKDTNPSAFDNTPNITISVSNDGTNFEQIGVIQGVYDQVNTLILNEPVLAMYVRATYDSHVYHHGSEYTVTCECFDVYGRELKVSVPKMTSNTEPWGVVSGIYQNDIVPCWKAFDMILDDTTTRDQWQAYNQGIPYIDYNFKIPVCIKLLMFRQSTGDERGYYNKNISLFGSNDGVTFTKLGDYECTRGSLVASYFEVDNDIAYKIYRLKIDTAYYANVLEDWCTVSNIQYYGFDYSEYDWDADTPRRYLYDHGVELSYITLLNTGDPSTNIAEKTPNSLHGKIFNPGEVWIGSFESQGSSYDLSDYNLTRWIIGNRFIGAYFRIFNNDQNIYRFVPSGDSDLPNNISVDISNANGYGHSDFGFGVGEGTEHLAEYEVQEWWLE